MLESLPLMTVAIGLAAISMFAMAGVAWIDVRQFEIHPGLLLAVIAPALAAIVLLEGLAALSWSAAAGALFGGIAFIAASLWPGRIGQGDVGLLGSLGVVGGPELLPILLLLFAVFAVLTSAAYSLARGKRLFRSMIPAALPAMGAAVPVFAARIGSSLWPDGLLGRAPLFNITFIISL